MKKLFALVLAVMMLFGIGRTTTAEVATQTEYARQTEWLKGYSKRCNSYRLANVPVINHHRLQRILLLPLMLFIGTAHAETTVKEKKEAPATKPGSFTDRNVRAALSGVVNKGVVEALLKDIAINDLKKHVMNNNLDALMTVSGIGPKRAELIVKTLRSLSYNVRRSVKASAREKAESFAVRTFSSNELFRDVIDLIKVVKSYRYSKKENPEVRAAAVENMKELRDRMTEGKPLTVRRWEGRVTRLVRFILSDVFGVDYASKSPAKEFIVLEHEVQKVLDLDWHLFGNEEKEARKELDKFQQRVLERIGFYGVRVMERDDTYVLYGGLASSASHQKKEKLLMGKSDLIKAHEKFLWFGKTMDSFLQNLPFTGAEYWKMRANEIRPIMKPFQTADGEVIGIKDVLFVEDVKKVYKILNARIFGEGKGEVCRDGQKAEKVILGDGAILSLVRLLFQGQGTAAGLKGMVCDGYTALLRACKKHGITLQELYDTKIKGLDGKMHRIGDYKLICGEGCWKFDKAFSSVTEYVDWLTEMGKAYPGIDRIYLLRQAEEIDGEEKIRKLTGTFLQQLIFMSGKEQRKVTAKVRKSLRKQKTFTGAVEKMAGLWKSEEDRTSLEKAFKLAPWMVLAPGVQKWLENKWNAAKTEAMSGKFRTEGQYPYIMQDPVALYEVWLFGVSPDSPNLGVLRGDEVSVADVTDGRKVACLRFPANFLTAKVMLNKAYADVYESCNNVAIISIYSDILICQDGDVDGDEFCVMYSKLVIEMVERMIAMFHPPVVLFQHGNKAEKKVLGDYSNFVHEAYLGLWKAKRYDQVGIYANLATACAYLASIDYAIGDMKAMQDHLLWMSAASTGAILAIDQVKGNAVDEKLIKWLEDIRQWVLRDMRAYAKDKVDASISDAVKGEERTKSIEAILDAIVHPFNHYYVAMQKHAPVTMESCAPADERNLRDALTKLIDRDAGEFRFDAENVVWNRAAAAKALLDWSHPMLNNALPTTAVRAAVITKSALRTIANNWANRQKTDENDEFFRRIRSGEPIGQKNALVVFYQNEAAICRSMEGKNLAECRALYRKAVKEILFEQADSIEWTNKNDKAAAPVGYVFTKEEKHAAVANSALIDAFELQRENGVDGFGYTMFVAGVFEEELLANIKRNTVRNAEFLREFGGFLDGFSVVDLELDVALDAASDEDELYEDSPAPRPQMNVEDIPEDYIPESAYVPEENGWFGSDEDYIPDDITA